MSRSRYAVGLSLVEVVLFIVVLAVGFVGILAIYNQTTRASVDPLVRKQAIAIATSLMEEIQLRAFTICDPDDPNVTTAASTAGCTSAAHVENLGPETIGAVETRYANPAFDNVSDYAGFAMGSGQADPSIRSIDGVAIPALADYFATVQVVTITGAGELPSIATNAEALRITVTVGHAPSGLNVALQGYRVRYAPNSP